MDTDLELFVPGRVCLFGEHTDWAGSFRRFNSKLETGKTIVVGTNAGLFARVRPHPDQLIMYSTDNAGVRTGPFSIPMNAKALLQVAQEGGFWSYGAGVAYSILTDYRVGGLVIDNYKTTLPLKKGLSSSAAICVLVARAFNRIYDLKMTLRGEMNCAYTGELMTPSRCGRMDQACAFGNRCVVLSYDGDFVDVAPVSVPVPLFLVLVDLRGKKDTVEILSALQSAFPFPSTDGQRGVVRLLGEVNTRISAAALAAMTRGDVAEVGRLMTEAQAQFDALAGPACPAQLTAPLLHKLLGHPSIQPLVLGGKGVGAGGDGTAQLLCRSAADQATVCGLIEAELGMHTLTVTIAPSSAVTHAVIPAAAFTPGLFPACKAVRPELLPVLSPDGTTAVPAIVLAIEELVAAGVESVCIVVQPEDIPSYRRLFKERLSPGNEHRLQGPAAAAAEARLLELGRRVTLVEQAQQEGLGHALWCARDAVGDHPFLVVLSDHVYRGAAGAPSCVQQLVDAFQHSGARSAIALQRSGVREAQRGACATGIWAPGPAHKVLTVTDITEKPAEEEAAGRFCLPALGAGICLSAFGMYIVSPAAWPVLGRMVSHGLRTRDGTFDFTAVLDELRCTEGLTGVVIEGERFDLDTPGQYARALTALTAALPPQPTA